MTDFYDRIFFKLLIDEPTLDQFEPNSKSSVGEHDAELVINSENDIYIRIFSDELESLDRKVMSWQPRYLYSILSKFEVISVIQPTHLLAIDFKSNHSLGMESSTTSIEFSKTFFVVKCDGVKLIYSNSSKQDSRFFLNDTAFNLIELNYRYFNMFGKPNHEFAWQPNNNIKEFITFNDIGFIPEHFISNATSYSESKIELLKEPSFRIAFSNGGESAIKKHAALLCNLYSFYSNKKIDWSVARIYTDDRLYIEYKQVPHEVLKIPHGIFMFDFLQNPLNLVRNVDAHKLIDSYEVIDNLINRFNYSFKTEGETKFMILYSLLEQLRNLYVELHKEEFSDLSVKDEYDFTKPRNDVNNFIRSLLNKILEIVSIKDQDVFKNDINSKVPGIKQLSMQDQFESYFNHVKVDPSGFGLDFKELKRIRNKIFHGHSTESDTSLINKINWFEHLPKFTGLLMLKYFGIENLNNIEKTRPFG